MENCSHYSFLFTPDILCPLLNQEVRQFGKVRHQDSVYRKLQSRAE